MADTTQLKTENERLKADSAILKAHSDKADGRADKAEAEAAHLKAAFCSKFPICRFVPLIWPSNRIVK